MSELRMTLPEWGAWWEGRGCRVRFREADGRGGPWRCEISNALDCIAGEGSTQLAALAAATRWAIRQGWG